MHLPSYTMTSKFATDSPWSDQKETLEFVQNAGFSEEELADLLGNNAQKLLGI